MVRDLGWREEDAAAAVMLLGMCAAGIGRALRDGSSALAASTHALADAIARNAAGMNDPAPQLYLPLRGVGEKGLPFGLSDIEPAAEHIETPDATNCCAISCAAPLRLSDDPRLMGPGGCFLFSAQKKAYFACDSDVVCIQSRANDEAAHHTAACFSVDPVPVYALPPNTLLTLKCVTPAPFTATFRRWHRYRVADGTERLVDRAETIEEGMRKGDPTLYAPVEVAPDEEGKGGGTRYRVVSMGHPRAGELVDDPGYDPAATFSMQVNRRLLILGVTYLLPEVDEDGKGDGGRGGGGGGDGGGGGRGGGGAASYLLAPVHA
mmetsp:Transcript_21734/g.64428  ORF Transcript_21734/g.64428 Transcript_21734/m.64428 type:complete len:321 (-) Transcript_21734:1035-1997(-)